MNRWKWAGLVMASPLACLIAMGFAYCCPLGWPKPFRQTAFDRVVGQIQNGALRPDRQGVVTLPRDVASLSATGRVYVRRSPSGRLVVFFPSWVGRDTLLISSLDDCGDNWLEGYIYDSRPWSYNPAGTAKVKDDYTGLPG